MHNQNRKQKKLKRGMVALFPAIIVSSILMILCVSISQTFLSFLYRTTLFDEKSQTDIMAHACSLRVLAKYRQNKGYLGGESFKIGDYQCDIGSIFYISGRISARVTVVFDKTKSVEDVLF